SVAPSLVRLLAPIVYYTLSLHDALPIYSCRLAPVPALLPYSTPLFATHYSLFASFHAHRHAHAAADAQRAEAPLGAAALHLEQQDRKSTRLNSSHVKSSYAVFCLKKKKR